jgi:alpha-tubulin suppressor-like RCC1 family protein
MLLALPAMGCAATTPSADGPCRTAATHRYVDVSAARGTTCAVRASGGVDCWGIGYRSDQAFHREGTRYTALGVTDAKRVDVGRAVCIEHADDTRPVCLGQSASPIESRVPLAQVAAGGSTTCALSKSGLVFCWGSNKRGEVGSGKSSPQEVVMPTQLEGMSGIAQIDMGTQHGCGVDQAGKAWCWGEGGARLGRSQRKGSQPQPLPLDGVALVAAGPEHSCAILSGGAVRCWGKNDRGQLGGEGPDSWLPVEVAAVSNAEKLALGRQHSCALLTSGDVVCWGSARYKGPRGVRAMPLSARAVDVAAGNSHSCAVLETGQLECWGPRRPKLDESCK